MKRFLIFCTALTLLTTGVFAERLRQRALQVSTETNGWSVLAPTQDTSQATFDWIDDNWAIWATTGQLATVSNQVQSLSNYVDQRFVMTNDPAYLAALTNGSWVAGSFWGYTMSNRQFYLEYPTNIAGLFGDFTNTVQGIATNTLVVSNTTTIVTSYVGTNTTYGVLLGTYVCYNSTTAVTITNGMGWSGTDYFCLTQAVSYSVTTLASADTSYIYIDSSASTFPNTLSFYDGVAAPALNAVNYQWVNATNSNDRYIGAVLCTNGAATVLRFYRGHDGAVWWPSTATSHPLELQVTGNPDGTWQSPTTEPGVYLPVTADRVLLHASNSDGAGRGARVGVTTQEDADLGAVIAGGSSMVYSETIENTDVFGYLILGPSKNIRWQGEGADLNNFKIQLFGYTEVR